jgi:hypothetical protein
MRISGTVLASEDFEYIVGWSSNGYLAVGDNYGPLDEYGGREHGFDDVVVGNVLCVQAGHRESFFARAQQGSRRYAESCNNFSKLEFGRRALEVLYNFRLHASVVKQCKRRPGFAAARIMINLRIHLSAMVASRGCSIPCRLDSPQGQ